MFSRVFRAQNPAPCSAFLLRGAESDPFDTFDKKALQGAGKRGRKVLFSAVFRAFPPFPAPLSGLPTHHFEPEVVKRCLLTAFDGFCQLLPEVTSGAA